MENLKPTKLLKVSREDLEKLAEVNRQVKNVILVPCCYGGLEGIFVNYNDMISPVFSVQRNALTGFSAEDVIEHVIEELSFEKSSV